MSDDTAPHHDSSFRAPSLEELATLLPQFQMIDLLAQGGMGAVYLAKQISLDRLVAIKVLPAEWGAEQGYAQRFQVEARSMAKLQHNHIVGVFDFGITSAGHLYLVMEYVAGQTLHDMIRLRRLPLMKVQGIVLQLCDGVEYAHKHGVLHRDLKPGNVLMSSDGQVKIADFGLARHAGAEVETESLGTPDYAAPELLQEGAMVDHRADIFALGIVIQEMLAGQVPRRPREPLSEHGQFDPAWETIIEKATRDIPAARYKTVRELSDAVAEVGKRRPQAARAPAPVRRPTSSAPVEREGSGFPWMAVMAVLFIIGVAGFWWMRNRSELPGAAPSTEPAPAVATVAPTVAPAPAGGSPTVSPQDSAPMPGTTTAFTPGAPLKLPEVPPGHVFKLGQGQKDVIYDVAVFPDQHHAASCGADGTVCVWDLQSGDRVRTFGPMPGYLVRVVVSPDGRHVAAGGNDYKAYVWSMDAPAGTAPKEAAVSARNVNHLVFSADGASLLLGTSDSTQSLLVWDWQKDNTPVVVPGLRSVVGGLELQPGGQAGAFIVTGTRADSNGLAYEVWTGDLPRRSLVRQLASPSFPPFRAKFTKDGRTAVAMAGSRISVWDVETGHTVNQSEVQPGGMSRFELVDGGRLVLFGAQDRCLHLLETMTGREVWKSEPADANCTNAIAALVNEQYVVTGGGLRSANPVEKDGDYALHVWRLPELSSLKTGDADKVVAKRGMLNLESSDPELWTQLGTLAAQWDAKVIQGAQAARKDLDDKYLALLRRDISTVSPRDREAYLAEISRVANRAPGTAPAAGSPPALVRLNGFYTNQISQLPVKARSDREQLAAAHRVPLDAMEKRRLDAGDAAGAERVTLVKEALAALEGEMVLAKIQDHFRPKAPVVVNTMPTMPTGSTTSAPVGKATGEVPAYAPRGLTLQRPARLHDVVVWRRGTMNPTANRLGTVPPDLGPVLALAVGDRHAIALKPDGTVVQWGNEDSRILGAPDGLDHIVAVTAGPSLSAALRDDGVAIAWNSTQILPQRQGLGPVASIHPAFGYALLRHQDGTVSYMGGTPTSTNAAYSPPPGLADCMDVCVPTSSAFALLKDGTVTGWGRSNRPGAYQMAENMPKAELTNGISIAANVDLGFMLKRTGEIVAWGAQVPAELAARPRFPGASRIVSGRPFTGLGIEFQPGVWKFLSLSDNRYPIDIPTAEQNARGCTWIGIGQYFILGLRPK